MNRAFVDASVLFSAIQSSTGYARDLLRLSLSQAVTLVVSSYVLDEVRVNLARKAPLKSEAFEAVVALVGFVLAEPTTAQVQAAAEYTVLKDAPVVAAAIAGRCRYLVTFDRKHLLDPPAVSARSGLLIVTPDIVVHAIQSANETDGERPGE